MNYFVTAIHTDSGKTLISAILCEALQAEYWKPIQAGTPTDSDTIRSLAPNITIHPEGYRLQMPASPHAAARAEGITIKRTDFTVPKTSGDLIIEGAGGCLVPINDSEFVIDLASWFQAKVILVANLYLGSINHTLLTYEALRSRNLTPLGIIFNGPENTDSEDIILRHTGLPCLLRIAREEYVTPDTIKHYAEALRKSIHQLAVNWY